MQTVGIISILRWGNWDRRDHLTVKVSPQSCGSNPRALVLQQLRNYKGLPSCQVPVQDKWMLWVSKNIYNLQIETRRYKHLRVTTGVAGASSGFSENPWRKRIKHFSSLSCTNYISGKPSIWWGNSLFRKILANKCRGITRFRRGKNHHFITSNKIMSLGNSCQWMLKWLGEKLMENFNSGELSWYHLKPFGVTKNVTSWWLPGSGGTG